MRRKVTVTLTLMVGSEPWVRVATDEGKVWKMPASSECFEIFKGIEQGWSLFAKKPRNAEATVRVPVSLWRATVARAALADHEET